MTLSAARLSYGYPGRTVGANLSFDLAAGEVLCVLGPNGGGKTTLFRTLLGLLTPQGGAVAVDGRPVASWSRRELARTVGYVPQAHDGHFSFTVREVVVMGRTAHLGLFGTPARRDYEVAEQAIDSLGLARLAHCSYTEISAGERQLTLIARALAQGPSTLIMDEPTTSLDFGNQVAVLNRIASLAKSGISILFSTHDPDHAFWCAGRVMLLRQGGLLDLGAPESVISRDNLRQLYGVSVDIVELSGQRRTCLPALR